CENNASFFVDLIGLRPNIHVALWRARRRMTSSLEPWMLIARMVDDELDHNLHVSLMSRIQERLEIVQRPVRGIHVIIARDVVAVVAERRREKGQEPNA